MDIVRNDTLFGSKKNIVGSTSADLVLETLGKVYIKTGKRTRTLTEILSEYAFTNNKEEAQSTITTEQISEILSDEYISALIDRILIKRKIYGDFVTVDSLKDVGNENLPIYFDSNANPTVISGLNVPNRIETEDLVCGQRGVCTAGIGDLVLDGASYGLNGLDMDLLRLELSVYVPSSSFQIFENSLGNLYKSKLNDLSFSGTSLKTLSQITQNLNGLISATFVDILTAGIELAGIVSTTTQTFSGDKTFNNNVSVNGNIYLPLNNNWNEGKGLLTPNGKNVISFYNALRIGDSYYSTIIDGYSILFENDINLKNNSCISFDDSSNHPVELMSLSDNNRILLGTYNHTVLDMNIYGNNIKFYSGGNDANYQSMTLNGNGVFIEKGLAWKGIADLTIDLSANRISALEARVSALENANS